MLIEKIKPLIEPRTIINLHKSDSIEDSQFISHFGGIPYFEKGETWPINGKTNKQLSFIFQIINNGNLNMPNEIGILQFYYDWDQNPWDSEESGWLVKVYSKIDKEKSIIIKSDTSVIQSSYCSVSFSQEKSLPDWEGINELNSDIADISIKSNPDEPWVAYDNVVIDLIGEQDHCSFIGGYPKWIQGESTPNKNGKRYKLLCQIDSEDDAGIMWGDVGSIYLFYNPVNQTDIMFSLQCY
jgi:uncharacterized protein YwqG